MHKAWLGLAAAVALGGCGESNGGWSSASDTPQTFSFLDVWAFAQDDVWFVDGGETIYRYDGNTFGTLDAGAGNNVSCIFALSATDVLLCSGDNVLRYDGSTFTPMDVATPTGLDGVAAIWASDANNIWAVGDDAIVAHYDGDGWNRTLAGSPFQNSIWGSGPNDIYVSGTFDLIHYDGNEWTEIDLRAGSGDGQVWGTGPSDVWVMTDSSELGHYNGSEWETVELDDFVGDLATVWGPAPDDLWAAGSAGTIAHYDGKKWTEVTHQKIGSPFLRQFFAIHGSSSDDVWAVGHQLGEGGAKGVIYHR